MNGDLSLSQSLGGLRIANPDEEDPISPPSQSPEPVQQRRPLQTHTVPEVSEGEGAVPRRPSQASSSSTVTERQKPIASQNYTLDPPAHDYASAEPGLPSPALSSRGLAPNPENAYGTSPPQSTSPLGHASPLAAVSSTASHSPRLSHRQSMPLAHQAQQQVSYPPYAAGPLMQQRNAPQPQVLSQAMRERPVSTSMYNHPNLSTSSTTAPGTYRYNDEGMTSDIRRTSSSRVAPNAMPVREASRRDPYRQSAQMSGLSGPLPPRRSSRRMPMDGAGMAPQLSSSPYSMEGGPLSSSEEWKEKGAAVSTRQEVDQNGRPITRVVKKGVKDFNFGRTLGEGSYSTVLAATDRQTLREYAIKVLDKRHIIKEKKMHVKITDFGTAKILDLKKSNGVGSTSGDPMEGAETDRAQSFVGTAEYVSPELLTDKNACKASDLWAFGCIIYQLIAGRPPFKAANEYMTFQKIVGLEYSFPDGFPPLARDLVERLLVLDPLTRLPMEHIKAHPFFESIIWGKGLWKQKAPRLKSYSPPPQEPIKLNGPSNTAVPPPAQVRPKPRLITELPPPSQLDIDWSPVLTKRDERILKLGNFFITQHPAGHPVGGAAEAAEAPKKFSRFFSSNTIKKRQRLVMITSNARLLMCAAGTNDKKLKEEVSLLSAGCSWRSFQDSKGLTAWLVETRDKQFVFEDPKSTTSDPDGSKYSSQEWIDSIEQARDYALSQAPTNDLALSELGSISTPSSLGGDSALDGVNIPASRHNHLHKDRGDTDSVKSRKRFSKRHSKNGLANF
ncbi:pkb-activating kinase-like protein [Didymella keratinophila]|nr:pkb-activating kinase-like protein [Didymella keratinophila]